MINSNWKKTIGLFLSVFVLSLGSVTLTGCDSGEEVEIESGGEEVEIEEEDGGIEVEED